MNQYSNRPLRSSGYGQKNVRAAKSKKIQRLPVDDISTIYSNGNPQLPKKSSSGILYSKDVESLQHELQTAKAYIQELCQEKKTQAVKIQILQESLVKLGKSTSKTFDPHFSSFSAGGNKNDSSQESKFKIIIRNYEAKTSQLQSELNTLHKNLRYTKLLELENELKVYYQEMVRMKIAYDSNGNVHELFEKIQNYKETTNALISKVSRLQTKETFWKESNQKLIQQRDLSKAQVKDLKQQLKINSKELDHKKELDHQIKELNKRIREHELEKVRIVTQHSQVVRDLEEYILDIHSHGDSSENIKIDPKRIKTIIRRGTVVKNKPESGESIIEKFIETNSKKDEEHKNLFSRSSSPIPFQLDVEANDN